MTSIEIRVTDTVTTENFLDEAAQGNVTFYRVRENESTRKVAFLPADTAEREVAEWVQEQRDAGRTMRSISEEMHLSIPSVRRILNALLLTEEVEGYDVDDIAELLAFEPDEEEPVATEQPSASQPASA